MFAHRAPLSCVLRLANKLKYRPLFLTSRQTGIHTASHTIQDCFNNLRRVFKSSGITEAEESAWYIVASALGKKTLHGVDLTLRIDEHALENIESMRIERLNGCPVQYVIKEWDFHSVTLMMRSPVFIPRPETEELVELALHDPVVRRSQHFLEVGCGSGAICIALLKHLPLTQCTAIECSDQACLLTRDNAFRNDVTHRLNILNARWTPDLVEQSAEQWNKFDFLISNPPYIPTEDMKHLQREVIRYEDHLALDGGIDGLDAVRNILQCANAVLKSGSSVWLEVDTSHPPKVQDIVESNSGLGLKYVKTHNDFTGRSRFCHLRTV